ncbi:protein suppressor of gene silencing 3 [Phtheirospermum japonicum]|uniref:Protein suppressor of gene silencing 3 n=1 Tax=Phtheirospermum japonicum TaxID=374723 RepID=A0A830CD18_9LAMI|nr:protein suppressor of gene silencing 3 [Phtheirospermum japonicum]
MPRLLFGVCDVDDGGEEFDDVDDSDDDLLSEGFDSDESQKSHETRKNRWFKELFQCLDELTVEQINEPERQWHYPGEAPQSLAELLDETLKRKGTSAVLVLAGKAFGKRKGLKESADKQVVRPPMVVITNAQLERDENEKISDDNKAEKHCLATDGEVVMTISAIVLGLTCRESSFDTHSAYWCKYELANF